MPKDRGKNDKPEKINPFKGNPGGSPRGRAGKQPEGKRPGKDFGSRGGNARRHPKDKGPGDKP